MGPGVMEKKSNNLPLWGNEKTMNLNNMILTNVLSSHYFKVNLYQLKTYHEVVDEIFYNVSHLEPWEKGSRKTAGQTGMCGGVRGVGAGGIVSTAFCILYKLFTLKLTRKQLTGLINHCDSPYIRGLGFMYIRYTQPPSDLWEWYEPYLDDEEEVDVKAGGGQTMRMGEIVRHMLSKLEWYSTLFPRIPVPIQKDLERKLSTLAPMAKGNAQVLDEEDPQNYQEEEYQEEEELVPDRKREEIPRSSSSRHRESDRNDRSSIKSERLEHEHRPRKPSPNRRSRHHHHKRSRSRSRTRTHSEPERNSSRERRHHRSDRYQEGGSSGERHHHSSRSKTSRRRSSSRDRSRAHHHSHRGGH